MLWQDIVLTIGSWIFIVALIPTLRGKEKPQLSTSIVTGTVLLVYAFVYATLGLWISVISTSALALAWLVLAVQKWKKMGNLEWK
ncbi:MAG: hypothetical protein HYT72_04060 [Candidatus Aenigmarchaeota archaeon]|nr:hypothetical protein [Candidatus Aenigmarchaeota archaeon]